jgi:hypothetical protein
VKKISLNKKIMKFKKTASSGTSSGILLFLVFLILKLMNVIDWSWWWVTCPLWIGVALVLLFILLSVLFLGLCLLIAIIFKKPTLTLSKLINKIK